MTAVQCRIASPQDRVAAAALRLEVFVHEQRVPFVLEIDARDFAPSTIHLVASVDLSARGQSMTEVPVDQPVPADLASEVVATARLLCDGEGRYHVGRVAVRQAWRGRGIGQQVMLAAEQAARQAVLPGAPVVLALDAQEQAIGFYERLGYLLTERERFLDAGIWHREMQLLTVGTGRDELPLAPESRASGADQPSD